jgi:hypothetical protein
VVTLFGSFFVRAQVAGRDPKACFEKRVACFNKCKCLSETATAYRMYVVYSKRSSSRHSNLQIEKILNGDDIEKDTVIVEIYKLVEGATLNYDTILKRKVLTREIRRQDKREIREIVRKLFAIHVKKPPGIDKMDDEEINEIYNDSLFYVKERVYKRCHIGMSDKDTHFLTGEEWRRFYRLSCKQIERWENKGSRISGSLHDTWPPNFVYIESGEKAGEFEAVDYTGPTWGEGRGIDAGRFILNYIELALFWKNKVYFELAKYFLNYYEKVSGDKNIREAMCLGIILATAVKLDPDVSTGVKDPKIGRKLYRGAMQVLWENRFSLKFYK